MTTEWDEIGVEARARRSIRVRRAAAVLLLLGTIGAGLVVHAALPDSGATDIAGDALYATAAYLAVVLVAPRLPALAAGGIAAVWCVGVELFQLSGLPLAWGARFSPAMLVFGTVFDARDLVVYVVTIALLAAIDLAIRALVARWSASIR